MAKAIEIYKCEVCGNIVEMVHTGQGELVCCGQSMVLQIVRDNEEGLTEKHKPVIKKGESTKITIGSVEHPMESGHFIEWIELVKGENIQRIKLCPDDKPEAIFCVNDFDHARAYCNIHGLWKD